MAVTFREWGSRWLDEREREGIRSISALRCIWRCHLLEAPFVDRPIGEIRRAEVRAFLASRISRAARQHRRVRGGQYETLETDRVLARATVRHVATALHSMLEAAYDDEIIGANPASRIRLRAQGGEPRWTFLSAAELELVQTSPLLSDERRAIYLTAIYTGARRGELWGLRWSDVHLDGDRPRVVIARSFDGPTKTGRVGMVPLLPRARELLEGWRESTGADTELVFAWRTPARFGQMRGRYDTAGWMGHWSRGERRPGWSTRIGIERRVRFHDLRHTAASHLLMGTWGRRWSLAEVRDFLRHRSVRETERYAHLAPGSLFDAARETR